MCLLFTMVVNFHWLKFNHRPADIIKRVRRMIWIKSSINIPNRAIYKIALDSHVILQDYPGLWAWAGCRYELLSIVQELLILSHYCCRLLTSLPPYYCLWWPRRATSPILYPQHSLSQQGVWASFGHTNPQKSPWSPEILILSQCCLPLIFLLPLMTSPGHLANTVPPT